MALARVRFEWKGDAFARDLEKSIDRGLTAAAARAADEAVRSLGSSHGGVRSKPGHPPHTQSTTLANSGTYVEAKRGVAYYGFSVFYAPFLELGTRMMAARPFIRRVIEVPAIRNRIAKTFYRTTEKDLLRRGRAAGR